MLNVNYFDGIEISRSKKPEVQLSKKKGRITMNKIIEVTNLKKSYGKVQAVKDLSFYVETGKLFAFLGPNGAGKSTTIDIITTFLKKDEGNVTIDGLTLGKDDDKIRRLIGAVFQDNMLDELLTVKENIMMRGSLYGLKGQELKEAADRAIAAVEMEDFKDRKYGKLSGGQRRRADIARALVNTPKILFLDEPTTGLDPQTRKNVWETIRRLQEETGMTIFLTTHYMEEAAEADYVIIIDSGNIAAKGTPAQLKETYAGDFLKLIPKKNRFEKITKHLESKEIKYTVQTDTVRINIPDTLSALSLIDKFRDEIDGFEVLNGTMDDAFIAITGKEIRE